MEEFTKRSTLCALLLAFLALSTTSLWTLLVEARVPQFFAIKETIVSYNRSMMYRRSLKPDPPPPATDFPLYSMPLYSTDNLFQSINGYRASQNLTTLTKKENAECFAHQMAKQFQNQPCTDTAGADTVQLSNYPTLLRKCSLNVSDAKGGAVMPACVPHLIPSLVLSNFTQSQYSENLNDAKYTGIGIGSKGNWMVVVLLTSTPEGSFATYNAASLVSKIHPMYHLLLLLLLACFLL